MRKLIALCALTAVLALGCASNDGSIGGTIDEDNASYTGASSRGAQSTSGSMDTDSGMTTLHDEFDSTPNPSR